MNSTEGNRKSSGFTLVELTLAMSFVAVLLLVIATTTIQIANIYTKGITLKSINQSGRTLSQDLQNTISSSSRFDLVAANYINNVATGGRLCSGQYSYIWNYGNAININPANLNKYDDNSTVHFAKISDSKRDYCTNPASLVNKSMATELLDAGTDLIVVHYFDVQSQVATAMDSITSQQIYSISFVIGTNEKLTLSPAIGSGTECLAPNALNSNFSFCAVSQFNIIARAGDTID